MVICHETRAFGRARSRYPAVKCMLAFPDATTPSAHTQRLPAPCHRRVGGACRCFCFPPYPFRPRSFSSRYRFGFSPPRAHLSDPLRPNFGVSPTCIIVDFSIYLVHACVPCTATCGVLSISPLTPKLGRQILTFRFCEMIGVNPERKMTI